jgi:cytoskeletal protein CcmA (bactofilin family)
MWNRRKDEQPIPTPAAKPVSAQPASSQIQSQIAKEGTPMSTLPSRSSEPQNDYSRGNAAVLGKSVVVKGQVLGREDLTIDGEVEGTIELQEHRLTVGPSGKVNAAVKAREVVVLGTLHGNVETRDKLEIRKEAKMVGDVKTSRIMIEDGAFFKGTVDIVRAETPKPQPAAPPKPQTVTATAPNPGSGSSSVAAGAGEIKR